MDNKQFKAMIKSHAVKQVFALLNDQYSEGEDKPYAVALCRVYVSTKPPTKYYVQQLVLQDISVFRYTFEVNPVMYNRYWEEYEEDVKHVKEHPAATEKEIAGTLWQMDNPDTPMEHRKFWKLRADTLKFMLKDKRIENA